MNTLWSVPSLPRKKLPRLHMSCQSNPDSFETALSLPEASSASTLGGNNNEHALNDSSHDP